jgi:ABC-type lipoprotein release transport system permease subunit
METDPGLRLRSMQTYSAILDRTMRTERIMAILGGFFGLLALIIACLGIFDVCAFRVSRRVNEIGLRMALGASRGGILAGAARGCGDVGSRMPDWLSRGAYTHRPDPKVTFRCHAYRTRRLCLGGSGPWSGPFAAGWLPARRASRVDPMTALRDE